MRKPPWGTATDYSPSSRQDLMERYLELVDRCLANSPQRQSTTSTANKNQAQTANKNDQNNPAD